VNEFPVSYTDWLFTFHFSLGKSQKRP
jgi:hypothetical protein